MSGLRWQAAFGQGERTGNDRMMTRLIALAAVLALLFAVGDAGHTATLRVSSEWSYAMTIAAEDEGDDEEAEDPVFETFTVASGDSCFQERLHVLRVTDRTVTVGTDWEFIGMVYRDAHCVRRYPAGTLFQLEVGDELVLYEAGLCDATYRVNVICDAIE